MSKFEVKISPIFVKPHDGADRLELGNIGTPEGWQVVIAKERFVSGDMCAYIGENAVVPEEILKYYGYWNVEKDKGLLAGSKGDRVKAVRLRDEFSLGIVLPVIECKEGWYKFPHTPEDQATGYFKLDEDVSEILGVTKYEPPIPVCMAGEVYNAGTHIGVNYDIENIKKFTSIFVEGEEVQVTEKIHGCVHPDTNIMLPNGEEIAIKHIIEDDRYTHVLSFDIATQQFIPKQITGKLRRPNNEKKRWMKMELEHNRVLRITEDHPIFSEDRNDYFPAKEIRPGENIKSPM